MQSVKEQNVMSLPNFDFLALSFAQMRVHGRQLDIDTIAGNMDSESKLWFLSRYHYYVSYLEMQLVKK